MSSLPYLFCPLFRQTRTILLRGNPNFSNNTWRCFHYRPDYRPEEQGRRCANAKLLESPPAYRCLCKWTERLVAWNRPWSRWAFSTRRRWWPNAGKADKCPPGEYRSSYESRLKWGLGGRRLMVWKDRFTCTVNADVILRSRVHQEHSTKVLLEKIDRIFNNRNPGTGTVCHRLSYLYRTQHVHLQLKAYVLTNIFISEEKRQCIVFAIIVLYIINFPNLSYRCPGWRNIMYRCINYKISKAIVEQRLVLWIDLGVHVIHLLP